MTSHDIVFEFLNQLLLFPPPQLLAPIAIPNIGCALRKIHAKGRTATAASVTPSSSAIAATSCGGLLWLITQPTWRPNINWVQLGACRQASVLPNISPLARGAMHIVAIPFFLGNQPQLCRAQENSSRLQNDVLR